MEKNRKEIIAKLNELSNGNKSQWYEDATWRKENRAWLKKSQAIALKILRQIRENKQLGVSPCTQVELANALGVKPQQVNKWVKGKENFTLETIDKIEKALKVDLIHIVKPHANVSSGNKFTKTGMYGRITQTIKRKRSKPQGKVVPFRKENTWSDKEKYAY